MIDLSKVRATLGEIVELIDSLDGEDLDETAALVTQSKGDARRKRAQMSQDLQFLAHRLELAAQLVRVEYWVARGESDPTNPERE